jgi:hypothetical protein
MAEEWQGIRSAPSGSSNYVEGGVMDIQKEKLIAEIENFKTEILKIQVVKVWAESHSNSDPFKHVILEKEDCKVWWMEAQAHQLWETWLAAKAQAVPEWNDYTKQSPRIDGRYQIFISGEQITADWQSAFGFSDPVEGDALRQDLITHWAMLPEPLNVQEKADA